MNEYLIEIKNLHKYFGKNEVLKGLDIQIKKGEVVVMIGPSGSGKSTFLRTMNLLEKPTDGQVYFEGVNIADKSVDVFKHREKMGMVFQQFNLFPNMTVLENLCLAPVKTGKMTKEEAKKTAELPEDRPGRPAVRGPGSGQHGPEPQRLRHDPHRAPPPRRHPGGAAAAVLPGQEHHRPPGGEAGGGGLHPPPPQHGGQAAQGALRHGEGGRPAGGQGGGGGLLLWLADIGA